MRNLLECGQVLTIMSSHLPIFPNCDNFLRQYPLFIPSNTIMSKTFMKIAMFIIMIGKSLRPFSYTLVFLLEFWLYFYLEDNGPQSIKTNLCHFHLLFEAILSNQAENYQKFFREPWIIMLAGLKGMIKMFWNIKCLYSSTKTF